VSRQKLGRRQLWPTLAFAGESEENHETFK